MLIMTFIYFFLRMTAPILSLIPAFVMFIWFVKLRTDFRRKFGIDDNKGCCCKPCSGCCEDCWVMLCCSACAMSQMYRHLFGHKYKGCCDISKCCCCDEFAQQIPSPMGGAVVVQGVVQGTAVIASPIFQQPVAPVTQTDAKMMAEV
jgi:hypothetical protein